jgi:AbrB family looped-hinge helix DNA binding protein
MSAVKVSARGQMVIPKEIRRRYKIEAGDEVELLDFGDQIVMIPIKDPIRDAKGWLQSDKSVYEMLNEAREEEKLFDERLEDRNG